jgi:ABC-type lipoprotein export system ATPase subunit
MITINNLSFQFENTSTPLFSHTNFSFPEYKLTFVEGKNGAGKSTLFQILMAQPTLQPSVQGTFSYQGTTYDLKSSTYKQFAQQHITRVHQRFDELLVPHLTFQENLACAQFATFPSCTSRITLPPLPLLAKNLHIPLSTPVHLLSGGQRQILAILTVLQRSSSILLLDEPTATLDEENSHLVMQFLCSLIKTSNLTILMISHDNSLYSYTDSTPVLITKNMKS